MSNLILPAGMRRTGDKCALQQRAEQWDKKIVRSFALVTVSKDNEINVDFDLTDLNFYEINALGAGVRRAYEELQALAAQNAPRRSK